MSSEVRLVAEPRSLTGSRPAGRLRAEGKVPAVVYGHGSAPRSVSVVRRELRGALTTSAGSNALLDLELGGETVLAIVKEMQRDAVRNEVTHVDFLLVSRDEVITVDVPIVLEGETNQVVSNDGTVDQQLFSLSVSSTPGNIPDQLTVDTSSLMIGDSVHVRDLTLPDGVTTTVDPDETVVIAQVSATLQEAERLDEEVATEDAADDDADEAEGDDASEETEG